MEQKNYQYLADALAKVAQTNALGKPLKEKMEAAEKVGVKDFTVTATKTYGKEEMQYDFKFSQGKEEKGNYFFLNQYRATLTKEDKTSLSQEFNLYQQKGFNVDEAHKLLNGGSVKRMVKQKGQAENVGRWYQLDFTQISEKGNARMVSVNEKDVNFNLVKELSKIPMSGASQMEKEALILSIERGGSPAITNKQNETLYIVARPQEATLVLFNTKGEEVRKTNDNSLRVVNDGNVIPMNNGTGKSNDKTEGLPDKTKQLIEKGQGDDGKQKQQQQQGRKVS